MLHKKSSGDKKNKKACYVKKGIMNQRKVVAFVERHFPRTAGVR